MEAKESNDGNF